MKKQRFELSQAEKDKMNGIIKYGPTKMNFDPMVGFQKPKPRVDIIKKQNELSKEDAHNLAKLLLTYYRKSRSYHANQLIKSILRPKKDKETRLQYTKRMMDLGQEMNKLADQIDNFLQGE